MEPVNAIYGGATHRRSTTLDIAKSKGQGKWAMLTSYEQLTAEIFEQAGIPVLLVGDSAGNNFLGGENEDYLTAAGTNFYIDWSKVEGGLIIKTLEGEHVATTGDWIIKGVKVEYYPCKPDIFKMTYELVNN